MRRLKGRISCAPSAFVRRTRSAEDPDRHRTRHRAGPDDRNRRRSGSGKTTLIKLIAGLLEPTDGTILFDNTDLRKLNYRDVRRHIGMVLQENHIFNETIARNIAFGDPEPDFDRVLALRRPLPHTISSCASRKDTKPRLANPASPFPADKNSASPLRALFRKSGRSHFRRSDQRARYRVGTGDSG